MYELKYVMHIFSGIHVFDFYKYMIKRVRIHSTILAKKKEDKKVITIITIRITMMNIKIQQ